MTQALLAEPGLAIAMELLVADAGVAAIAGDRLYPDDVPEGTAVPALSVRSISRIQRTPMSLRADAYTVTERLQVTPQCSTDEPTALGRLERAVAIALRPQRLEQCAGFERVVIEPEFRGPVLRDHEQHVRQRPMDFLVTYQELAVT